MSVFNFLGGFITLKAFSKAVATWGPFLDLIGIAKANLLNMSIMVTGADPGGGPGGPGPPPLTTKNEAPAPKFYKTEAPDGSFRPVTIWGPPPDQILDPPLGQEKSKGTIISLQSRVIH